jgi:predicted nucleic acid-binding protein
MPKSPSVSSPSAPNLARRAFVLDSFALFAYFENEQGADLVAELFEQSTEGVRVSLSIINLGELLYATERERGIEEATSRLADVREFPITLVGVTEQQVLAAAHIKAQHAVSYADAFAIALAQELNATIVTGDPEFQSVEKPIAILWLREIARGKSSQEKRAREHRAEYRTKLRRKRVSHTQDA